MSILLIASITFMGCSKDDDNPDTTAQTGQYLTQGSWVVEYFFDQTDETSDFANYTFTFHPDGNVSVSSGTSSSGGNWQVISNDEKRKLVINIMTNTVLQQLNNDWLITSSSALLIKLNDDNIAKHELRLKRK